MTRRLRSAAILSVVATGLVIVTPNKWYYQGNTSEVIVQGIDQTLSLAKSKSDRTQGMTGQAADEERRRKPATLSYFAAVRPSPAGRFRDARHAKLRRFKRRIVDSERMFSC